MKMRFFYLVTIVCAILVSCEKEKSYESGSGTGTSGSVSNADCKACIYIPICDGAWYNYADTTAGLAQTVSDTFRYVKDSVIGAKTFKKFLSTSQQTYSFFNCTDGDTRLLSYGAVTSSGATVSKVELSLLKANLPLSGTWTDTLINGSGQTVIYADSIAQKAVSRTVNGQTFPDVIQVHVETSIYVPGFGSLTTNATDYYYARAVGLIEVIAEDFTTNTVFEHRTIKTYFIP